MVVTYLYAYDKTRSSPSWTNTRVSAIIVYIHIVYLYKIETAFLETIVQEVSLNLHFQRVSIKDY